MNSNPNQGLIDMRNKAKELAEKSELGIFEPYKISCGTLIQILDELEYLRGKNKEVKVRKKVFGA
jgi:hypothetical protein